MQITRHCFISNSDVFIDAPFKVVTNGVHTENHTRLGHATCWEGELKAKRAVLLGVVLLLSGCEGSEMVLGDFAAALAGQPLPSQQQTEASPDPVPVQMNGSSGNGYPTLSSADRALAQSWSKEFPPQPADQRAQCDLSVSDFTRWADKVAAATTGAGACKAAKGAVLVNAAAADKARYCAQFYSGDMRAQAIQQAGAFDATATQAVGTAKASCHI